MIVIKDDIEKNRSLNLSDITNRIDSINEYYWKLMWVEGIAKDSFNMSRLEGIDKKTFNSWLINHHVDSWLWEISSKDELFNKKLKSLNAE